MNKINFITSNSGKIKALEESIKLHQLNIEVCAKDLRLVEPQFDTVQEVSKFKALKAFEILGEPVLVEDGGFCIPALNNFPGVYTKYILNTLGPDGILKLMEGNTNRKAEFVSVATFVNTRKEIFQFERDSEACEISKERSKIESPFAWSSLWQIIYLKEYNKNLCELSAEELTQHYNRNKTNGSIQKFVKWYAKIPEQVGK